MRWDYREYLRQRRAFLASRREQHPMVLASTLIFTATWFAGWLVSTALLVLGMESMPLRYALAFIASYGVFFACVRIWCNSVHHDRGSGAGYVDAPVVDGDGCLVVLAIMLASTVIVAAFWVSGGFTVLLEVAFEVAFAGTVVQRLGRTELVGAWARTLLAGTWPHALAALVLLVALAAWLQRQAPGATKFSEAVSTIVHRAR